MMNVGDKVRIVVSIDDAVPAKRVGEVGTIVKWGTGHSLADMTIVEFPDGYSDGYWPEEVERVI